MRTSFDKYKITSKNSGIFLIANEITVINQFVDIQLFTEKRNKQIPTKLHQTSRIHENSDGIIAVIVHLYGMQIGRSGY